MARIPDGWVIIPKIKNCKMAEVEIEVEKKELVFCEHCLHAGWKITSDAIQPEYYCHRRTEPELVDANHFCGYAERCEDGR